ncbi:MULTISPECIES: hypothetical protein [Photorhabdus]|nr:hypothetical protein [Photorhabdus asymbiotica]
MTGVSECSQQRGNLKDDGYSTNKVSCINIKQSVIFCSITSQWMLSVLKL